jgi:hypothetical protein
MFKNTLILFLATLSFVFNGKTQSPQLRSVDCSRTETQLTQYLYANIAGGVQYRFKVTNTNTSVTDSVTISSRRFRLNDMPSISRYGCTYDVQVAMDNGSGLGFYGNVCSPSSAAITTKLRAADCGKNLPNINTTVYASLSSADSWEFEVENVANPGITENITTVTRAFDLTMLSAAFQLYSQEYLVRVRTTQGGVLQPFGDVCSLFTPSITTKLRTSDCGRSLTSIDYPVYATVTSADSWDFEVRNVTDILTTEVINSSDREFRLTDASAPYQLYNEEYEIRVRTIQGGVIQPYGDWCSVFTPNVTPPDITVGCGNTFEYLAYESINCTDIGADQYEFLLRIGSTFVDTVYTSDNEVQLVDFLDGSNQPNYDYNTTYNIAARGLFGGVWTAYGTGCTITTTANAHSEVQHLCGSQLNSFNTPISSYAIFNATDYEYSVTDLTGTDGVQTINSTDRKFKLNELTNYSYGHIYEVKCRVTFKGFQYAYGTACSVTAPQPVTKLRSSDCPRLLTTLNKTLYANPLTFDNPSGAGLTEYRFKIGGTESAWQASRAITLETILGSPPSLGTMYSIEVQANYNGVIQSYGDACSVTTPVSMIEINQSEAQADKNQEQTSIVDVYPNPSNDFFFIKPKSVYKEEGIILRLYDLKGSLMSISEYEQGQSAFMIGKDLPKGVYYLHVYNNTGYLELIQLIKL